MKKALVILLCALAVFAIVSCKQEPEPKPEPKATYEVAFESVGGSAVSTVTVEEGSKATKPADPKKDYYEFGGWYTDSTFKTAYDFDAPVTESIVLIAKWAPVTVYKLTASEDTEKPDHNDRFQLRFKSSGDNDFLKDFKIGDVVSFQYKSTPIETSEAIARIRVRGASNYGGTSDFSAGIVSSEPDADGWITVTCTFADGMTFTETGLLIDFRKASGKGNIAVGDILEIKNLKFNGKEISFVKGSSSAGPYEGCKPSIETLAKIYKLTATKGTDGVDEHKYDQDKFTLYWNPNTKVNPGDVVTLTFKPVRTDDLTKDRPFTYSLRDAKKWFSEKAAGSTYPQFWSTFDVSEDGWITVSYVFPEATAETKEQITYPATFRIDFRDTVIASPAEERIADIIYVKNITLKSGETTSELTIDAERTPAAYSAPTIDIVL